VEGLGLITTAWSDAYQARFEGPVLAVGGDQRTAMERAARLSIDFLPLGDPALLAIYHRQEELLWTEGLVERIEHELQEAGMLGRPGRVPAMCFLDLVGYTRLTEEQGDQVAAALAETLAVLVSRSASEYSGVPVKWLGDGLMVTSGSRPGRCWRRWSWWPSSPRPACRRPMSGWRRGRWWSRAATTSAAPSTWPPGSPPTPARGRSWSAAACRIGVAPGRALRGGRGGPAQGDRPSGAAARLSYPRDVATPGHIPH
jgi:class 3 adenylate cyclase